MALFGISIRHGLNPEAAPTAGSKTPTRDMLTQHWRQVLRVALLNIGFGVAFYTVLVYAVTNVELMHPGCPLHRPRVCLQLVRGGLRGA